MEHSLYEVEVEAEATFWRLRPRPRPKNSYEKVPNVTRAKMIRICWTKKESDIY